MLFYVSQAISRKRMQEGSCLLYKLFEEFANENDILDF